MMDLYAVLDHPVVDAIGVGLLHAVWQGALIALLLAAALRLLRNARARYLAACAALAALLLLPVATGLLAYRPVAVPVELPSFAAGAVDPLSEPAASPQAEPVLDAAPMPVPAPAPSWRAYVNMVVPWLVLGWGCGVVVLLLRTFGGWALTQRLKASGTPVAADWQVRFDTLRRRFGLARPVQLLQTVRIDGPVVIGWLRPVVLVPVSVLSGLPPAQVELILLHELAHIRRYDYLVNLLQAVIEALLFFHPAVWWISKQVRIEREHVCDDLAVAVGRDRLGYARALAALEERRGGAGLRLALGAGGGSLLERVQRIAGLSPAQASRSGPLLAVLAVLCVMLVANLWLRSPADDASGARALFIHTTLNEALEEARRVSKPVLLYFYEDEYTGGFEALASLWTDEHVAGYVREHFVTAAVDARSASGERIIKIYDVPVVQITSGQVIQAPLIFILSPSGTKHAAIQGTITAGGFLETVQHTYDYVLMSYFAQRGYTAGEMRVMERSRSLFQRLRDVRPDQIREELADRRGRYIALRDEIASDAFFFAASEHERYVTREAFAVAQERYLRVSAEAVFLDEPPNMNHLLTYLDWLHIAEIQWYLARIEQGDVPTPEHLDAETLGRMRAACAWLLAKRPAEHAGYAERSRYELQQDILAVRAWTGPFHLQEGEDYDVDYQNGVITVTNPRYLTRDLEIDYVRDPTGEIAAIDDPLDRIRARHRLLNAYIQENGISERETWLMGARYNLNQAYVDLLFARFQMQGRDVVTPYDERVVQEMKESLEEMVITRKLAHANAIKQTGMDEDAEARQRGLERLYDTLNQYEALLGLEATEPAGTHR